MQRKAALGHVLTALFEPPRSQLPFRGWVGSWPEEGAGACLSARWGWLYLQARGEGNCKDRPRSSCLKINECGGHWRRGENTDEGDGLGQGDGQQAAGRNRPVMCPGTSLRVLPSGQFSDNDRWDGVKMMWKYSWRRWEPSRESLGGYCCGTIEYPYRELTSMPSAWSLKPEVSSQIRTVPAAVSPLGVSDVPGWFNLSMILRIRCALCYIF